MSYPRLLAPLRHRAIIGMIHLLPMPGTPRYGGSVQQIIDHAMADAEALHTGGIDAIMVENYGDVPFRKSGLEPHTIALMGLIATQVKHATQLPLGINALRNDPLAALVIAAACGGAMIRVNVHTAAMVTDQGIIEGNARGTIDYRTTLGVAVKVMADVNVKHALPLVPFPIEELAADATERGLADALIVTGSRTGAGVAINELRRTRAATHAPVFAGSGVTDTTITDILAECDGAIVGSWLKHEGNVAAPVDAERVKRLMEAARQLPTGLQ